VVAPAASSSKAELEIQRLRDWDGVPLREEPRGLRKG